MMILYRFIDALTPTLSSLHPLTVLNHLHSECIGRVEAANILNRDGFLNQQLQPASTKHSTAERVGGIPLSATSVYEEHISTQIQGTLILPKVNTYLYKNINYNQFTCAQF